MTLKERLALLMAQKQQQGAPTPEQRFEHFNYIPQTGEVVRAVSSTPTFGSSVNVSENQLAGLNNAQLNDIAQHNIQQAMQKASRDRSIQQLNNEINQLQNNPNYVPSESSEDTSHLTDFQGALLNAMKRGLIKQRNQGK